MNLKSAMKRVLLCTLLLLSVACRNTPSEYAIVANAVIATDPDWKGVVEALCDSHPEAKVLYYTENVREALPALQLFAPRYVAFVDRPEEIGRDYVIALNRLSRVIDDDPYEDYLWGIITGYDAAAAIRMVEAARTPLTVRSAVSTLREVGSGKWFDTFAYVDDRTPGICGMKNSGADTVAHYRTGHLLADGRPDLLREFCEFYAACDPDLVTTASHATERNLEMPFSVGNLRARDGALYADFAEGPKALGGTDKRRVFLPVGNCLIGNVNHTRESMAVAWMNSARAAAMVGYVVPTWYGRNGWGGLKYWLTTPGRYKLAEAFYLNRQDMLHQLGVWCPQLGNKPFPFGAENETYAWEAIFDAADSLAGRKLNEDEQGFFFDRDVVAFYGDPTWDVRLKELPAENDYTVRTALKDGRYTISVTTGAAFNAARMAGGRFKEEHVGDLPFSCFFPQRLRNPRLAAGQRWNAVVDENFLLVYDPGFESGKTYTIVLDTDR